MLAGHNTRGGVLSTTVIVKEQLGPAPVVQVTLVVPTANSDPEAGAQLTVPQVPEVVGEKLTTVPHATAFGEVAANKSAGQVIVQTAPGVTVTHCENSEVL